MSGHPEMVIISVPLTGFFMSLMGMNMLAYEGPAFILHTMSGLKGRVDWYARSAFQLGLGLLMQFIMTAIAFAAAIFWAKALAIPGRLCLFVKQRALLFCVPVWLTHSNVWSDYVPCS